MSSAASVYRRIVAGSGSCDFFRSPWLSGSVSVMVIIFAFALLPMASSSAHEQKVALTDIFFNERTGNLEIAHRFRLHDAEHALRKATELDVDLAKSAEAQAAFANYVIERFELSLRDKTRMKLTLVGQEIERGYLWVYQEIKIPELAEAGFFIDNTILQDVVKGQINTVNVRFGSKVATFAFEAISGRQLYAGPVESAKKSKADG